MAWRRRSDRSRVPGRQPELPGAGRQHLLRPWLPSIAAARTHRTGATVFGYWVRDPGALWRGRVRCLRQGDRPGGKAGATEVQLRGHRPVFLRWSRASDFAAGSNHRHAASWKSPTSTAAISTMARCSLEKMGRGHAWLDTGTHESLVRSLEFHRDHREAPGPARQLPGGDRLLQRLDRRRPAARTRAIPLAKNGYGQYLLGCSNTGAWNEADQDEAARLRGDRAAVFGDERGFFYEGWNGALRRTRLAHATSSSTTCRVRSAACCAACTTSGRNRRASWSACWKARCTTSRSTSAAARPPSASMDGGDPERREQAPFLDSRRLRPRLCRAFPLSAPSLSEKDAKAPFLADVAASRLPEMV
jgi:hypothetical protein